MNIPVYFIKGAIIPTEKDGNKILTIIPGKDSSFTIYLDDGISNNYKSVFVKRKVYQFSIEKYTIILKKLMAF